MRATAGLVIVLVSLAACGSPHAADGRLAVDSPALQVDAWRADAASVDAAPDAPAPDLSCLGLPPTTTAPDPLALAGKVFAIDHYQVAPFAGATVTLHRRVDDAVLATSSPSAADGTYALSVATGGVAPDAYFTIAASGELPVRIDPGDPLTTGYYALAFVAASDEVTRWYADAGAGATYSATTSTLISVAVDCKYSALGGTTLAVAPAASVIYYDAAAMRWDPTTATSTNGFSLVPSSAASESVTATWHSDAFPAHVAAAPAGVLSLVIATPHAPAQ